MTREESIEELKAIKSAYSDKNFHTARLMRSEHEALDMAIKALEQEPSGDLISRQAVLDLFQDNVSTLHNYARVWEAVEEMSSVTPSVNPQPCDDAIDREYLFKVLDDFCGHDRTATITLDTLADLVYDMPSVTQKFETVTEFADRCRECGAKYGKLLKQEPKTGHWIYQKGYIPYKWKCNQCFAGVKTDFNYCPNCGCRMVEPQESETCN